MHERFHRQTGVIYLAGTNQTLVPVSVLEARERHSREYELNPTQGMSAAWGRLWDVQNELAGLLGARPQDLFLRANATAVLNTLLLGIPIEPGGEVLVGELEYGAVVNIVRLRCARENVVMRSLKVPASPMTARRATAADFAAEVVSQLGPKTRLLVLSHAMGGTGLVAPIREIARETRRRGISFVVDGTHALGAFPVDFRELEDVDYYGVGLYKWMLGPKGTAFGWVHSRNQDLLQSTQGGWTTFEPFEPMSAFGGGSRFQERFLMHGCHDFAPYFAIADLVRFWREHGPETIYRLRRERYLQLQSAMDRSHAWRRVSPDRPELQAPMLVYRMPESLQPMGATLTSQLFERHRLQATAVNLRGQWCLVLSPHVYNTESELDRAAAILAELV